MSVTKASTYSGENCWLNASLFYTVLYLIEPCFKCMKFKEYGRVHFRFYVLIFFKGKVILVDNKGKLM